MALTAFVWAKAAKHRHESAVDDEGDRMHKSGIWQPLKVTAPVEQRKKFHCNWGVIITWKATENELKGVPTLPAVASLVIIH